jgi:hypothetical protein
MTAVRIENDVECDEMTFWRDLVFDAEFNRALYRDTGFENWELVHIEETETTIERTTRISIAAKALPPEVARVVEDSVAFHQEDVFDKAARRLTTRMIPPFIADLVSVIGETSVVPIGERRIRRVFDLVVKVSIPAVGRLAEKRFVEAVREGYDRGTAIANSYLRAGGRRSTPTYVES